MTDLEHYCHLSMRCSNAQRHRGHSDTELLLKGTKEEIVEHVSESLIRALGNGEVSEIRLVPVSPHNVVDIKKER